MSADDFGKQWNCEAPWNGEPCAEIVPECDVEFCASLGESEEGVAAVAAGIAASPAADLALGDLAANVVFRTVGVQRNLRPVEHHQQLGLVGMQPLEQAIESGEPGAAAEDAVEERWPGLSRHRFGFDKWSLCRMVSVCAIVGASRREGVARPE